MFRQCARSKENRRNISNKFKQYIYISTGTKENAIFGFGSPQRYISVPVCIVEVVWIVGSWYLCTGWIFGQLRMTVVSYDEMLDISLDGVATTLATKTKQSLLANSSGHAHGVNSSNRLHKLSLYLPRNLTSNCNGKKPCWYQPAWICTPEPIKTS